MHSSQAEKNTPQEPSKGSQPPSIETSVDLETQLRQARLEDECTLGEARKKGEENLNIIQAANVERNGVAQVNCKLVPEPFACTPKAPESAAQLYQQPRRYLQFEENTFHKNHQLTAQYVHPTPGPSNYPSPAHWTKIAISKFNGDAGLLSPKWWEQL